MKKPDDLSKSKETFLETNTHSAVGYFVYFYSSVSSYNYYNPTNS